MVKDENIGEHGDNRPERSGEVRGDKPEIVVNYNQQKIEKFFQKIPIGSKPSQKLSTNENGSNKREMGVQTYF